MTIPLSLIGQILLNGQHSSFVYWLGACVVVLSFVFVNHEEARGAEKAGSVDGGGAEVEVLHGQGTV